MGTRLPSQGWRGKRDRGDLGLAVLAFDIGTYSYYRGSVVTPYHGGPVSPARHHLRSATALCSPMMA